MTCILAVICFATHQKISSSNVFLNVRFVFMCKSYSQERRFSNHLHASVCRFDFPHKHFVPHNPCSCAQPIEFHATKKETPANVCTYCISHKYSVCRVSFYKKNYMYIIKLQKSIFCICFSLINQGLTPLVFAN